MTGLSQTIPRSIEYSVQYPKELKLLSKLTPPNNPCKKDYQQSERHSSAWSQTELAVFRHVYKRFVVAHPKYLQNIVMRCLSLSITKSPRKHV